VLAAKAEPSWKATPPEALPSALAFPTKVTALEGGRFAVSDSGHHRVLVFDAKGQLLQAIGSGLRGWQDGPAETAAFSEPQGLAAQGEILFVADAGNHVVRRVDLAGKTVGTIAGTGELGRGQRALKGPGTTTALRSPWDVAVSGDWLFIAMAGSNQVWRLTLSSGQVEPWLGNGEEDFVDGPAAQAKLARPSGLAVNGTSLFVADSGSSAVRQAHLATSETSTLVGTGLFTFGDADGPRSAARLQFPLGVTWLGDALYVADTYNGKIRRVAKDGAVTTVATGLSRPQGLAAVGERLLVADTDAHRLVWVDPSSGALEPVALGPLPEAAQGVVRPSLTLARAAVRAGATTVRLQIPSPPNETFSTEAPVIFLLRASDAATLTAEPAIAVEPGSLRLDLPLAISSEGSLTLDLDVYGAPKDKVYTRRHRVRLELPLSISPEGAPLVTVTGRLE
jgi:sugar lactone lactonase YvrE